MMCFVISYLYGETTAAHIPFVLSKHYYRKKKTQINVHQNPSSGWLNWLFTNNGSIISIILFT